jgi:hypothetical protein
MRPRNVARETLREIEVKNGSLLLVSPGSVLATPRNMRALAVQLTNSGKPDVVIVLADPNDIHHIEEAEMNRLGWYRREE